MLIVPHSAEIKMDISFFNDETKKIWKQISGNSQGNSFKIKFNQLKKITRYVELGESCYLLFNFKDLKFEHLNDDITNVLGYKPEEITPNFILDKIHPNDRNWFITCQNQGNEYFNSMPLDKKMSFKIQYDFRIKNKSNKYIRIILQSFVVQTDYDGRIMRTLSILINVSHLPLQNKYSLSIINFDDSQSKYNIIHSFSKDYDQKEKKYLNSGLNLEKATQYLTQLQFELDTNKIYLDANLTLPSFSKKLNIPIHQLSQLINQHYGMSFSNFINFHRINEFKKLLINNSKNHFKIEELGYMCGFNSKATFQRSFKKFEKISPKLYKIKNSPL